MLAMRRADTFHTFRGLWMKRCTQDATLHSRISSMSEQDTNYKILDLETDIIWNQILEQPWGRSGYFSLGRIEIIVPKD